MTQTRTSIVCGVDGTAGGAEATRLAAQFAAAPGPAQIVIGDPARRSPCWWCRPMLRASSSVGWRASVSRIYRQ